MEVDILGWWCGNRTLRNPLCWNFEPFTSWLNSIEKDFQIQISADHNILKIGCSLWIWFKNTIKKWFNPILVVPKFPKEYHYCSVALWLFSPLMLFLRVIRAECIFQEIPLGRISHKPVQIQQEDVTLLCKLCESS